MSETLRFKLAGKKFEIIDPNVRFGSMNAMALVSKLQGERPGSVEIEFDGSPDAGEFLTEVAADAGYAADLAGNRATLTPA